MEEQIVSSITESDIPIIPHDVNNCECCAHENNNNVDNVETTVVPTTTNQQPDLQSMLSNYPSLATLARGVSPGMSNSALSEVMKFANTEEGKKLADSLKKKGVKRKQAVRDYRNMKRNMKSVMGNKTSDSTNTSDITDRKCKVVLLTSGRKLKEKTFQFLKLRENICSTLHCTHPTELCCSSLSRGSLTNKEIRVWYDDTNPVKNKRLSRLLGFPCTGEAIIVCYESDITISDIEDVESLCSNNV